MYKDSIFNINPEITLENFQSNSDEIKQAVAYKKLFTLASKHPETREFLTYFLAIVEQMNIEDLIIELNDPIIDINNK